MNSVATHEIRRIGELLEPKQSTETLNAQQDRSDLHGIPSGFKNLDDLLGGFQRSDLVVIASRPSVGKSILALNIARNVALDRDLPVLYFCLESSAEQLTRRLLASVPAADQERLKAAPLFIDDTPSLALPDLCSKARDLHAHVERINLVVVDYIHLVDANTLNPYSRVEKLDLVSRELKILARELDCPVIALAHLSRAVEARHDKRPVLSDLRESSALQDDADVILFIYRDRYYNPDSEAGDRGEIIIAKNRHGCLGKIELLFRPEQARFSDG